VRNCCRLVSPPVPAPHVVVSQGQRVPGLVEQEQD
jgi:hypothetical protein